MDVAIAKRGDANEASYDALNEVNLHNVLEGGDGRIGESLSGCLVGVKVLPACHRRVSNVIRALTRRLTTRSGRRNGRPGSLKTTPAVGEGFGNAFRGDASHTISSHFATYFL
ncbi:MAG: hypothetical protein A3G24_25205 [Betaproteobacteria bacterium RIFCSPLOWO2_12_FULL_62_13]|nr:MAG: hypothetical protein A3G24_25205 [Betaproteobacteria bacterium RIFCSPLOWO2_12_FULL_62_13]